ncbi:MAG: hypothetical protein GF417_04160 [Candidatus Latescibacteria bacterium]|nr:hypothetical protein [bacterium]MBD3423620.1 hypothetical protein [Candidatus Latescibacterota bacterium]
MNTFLSTFEAVATLLVIGVVGFWMVSRNLVKENFFSLLSPLALEVALPALVFVNIIENFNPAEKAGWWKLPAWWLVFTLISFSVVSLGLILSRKETRSEFGLSLFYQNGLFIPLTIIAGVFGINSEYTVDLFFLMILYPAFFFNTYYLFFHRSKGNLQWSKIFHPVFIMTLLAIIVRMTGINTYIPGFVVSGLQMVGNMAVPLLMLILGGNMLFDFQRIEKIRIMETVRFIFFKNLLMPAVMLLFLYWVRPGINIALILMLEASAPPVTAAPLLSGREGGDRELVNQYMIGSFSFSLITIPLFIYLLGKLYPLL